MELNGFMIGPEIKTLFKIKVGAVIAEHPVGGTSGKGLAWRLRYYGSWIM